MNSNQPQKPQSPQSSDLYAAYLKAVRCNNPGTLILVQNDGDYITFEPDCWLVANVFDEQPVIVERRWQIEITPPQVAWLEKSYPLHIAETPVADSPNRGSTV